MTAFPKSKMTKMTMTVLTTSKKTSAFVDGLIEIEYLCTRKVFITNENLFSFPLLNRNFALSLHRES